MSHAHVRRPLLPHIVATGFTTALLGDERTLREFVVGDSVAAAIRSRGGNAVLYLINDSYDPLDVRQLRVGVDKDPRLTRLFEPFCGRPIAQIPDPYDCHASYSDHFLQGLVERLDQLDIHPIVHDSYQAYQAGHYEWFVATTFERYQEIRDELVKRYDYTLRNLFRAQCPQCLRIDTTQIGTIEGRTVGFRCEHCELELRRDLANLRGKLSWKLDCAARWNLYRIDTEVFSKAHLAEKGTLDVSQFMSVHFYGAHVPEVVRYGDVRISREVSGRLLEILPPILLKRLMTDPLTRDLELTPAFVEHFARNFEVRPGMSYVDFVKKELPSRALQSDAAHGLPQQIPNRGLTDDTLVAFGNRFSQFFYQKEYRIRMPEAEVLASANSLTLLAARDLVQRALELRGDPNLTSPEVKTSLRSYLRARESSPVVYPFLRRVLGQHEGPNITTLVATLPRDYLETMVLLFEGFLRASGGALPETAVRDADREAA